MLQMNIGLELIPQSVRGFSWGGTMYTSSIRLATWGPMGPTEGPYPIGPQAPSQALLGALQGLIQGAMPLGALISKVPTCTLEAPVAPHRTLP